MTPNKTAPITPAATTTPLPPGPSDRARPLTVARFMLQPTRFLENAQRRYGDSFTVRLTEERTTVITADPATVKDTLQGDLNTLLAGKGNEVLGPLLGPRSVLLLDGPEHLRQRKLMLPPFHGERTRGYEQTMREIAERHVADWPTGAPFLAQASMQAITLEVILRTVFGLDDARRVEQVAAPLRRILDASSNRFRMLALQWTSSKHPRPRSPWGRFNVMVAACDEVVREEIAARRSSPEAAGRQDVLSLLLAARDPDGEGLTDDELRDELMTLLVAGHETTATALSWTLERITRHPEVLERLQAEHSGVTNNAADNPDATSPYLDAVITETLRLRPVIPAVVRYLTEPQALGGREFPAGVYLVPSIYLLHRRPDLYPDPTAFRPERFLDRKPGTYEWIPFGGGTRRCLGASFALFEMRVVLQTILSRVELAPAQEAAEGTTRRAITFAPARGGRIRVRHRRPRPLAGAPAEPRTAAVPA